MVERGEWYQLDEARVYKQLEALLSKSYSEVIREKARAIVARKPPALIARKEFLGERTGRDKELFDEREISARNHVKEWSAEFGIDENYWYVKTFSPALTSVGSRIPVSAAQEISPEEVDKLEQVVRIMDRDKRNSIPITEVNGSLMCQLSDRALYSIRIYLLLPSGKEHVKEKIRKRAREDLPRFD